MNKFSNKNFKNLTKTNLISISPLEMLVKNNKKQIRKYLAINEVNLKQSRQAASLSIKYGSKQIIKKLVSDCSSWNIIFQCMVQTISPISPFRPWKGKIVSDDKKFEFYQTTNKCSS